MISFLGMGADQLADSSDAELATGDRVKFRGDDGTAKYKYISATYSSQLECYTAMHA